MKTEHLQSHTRSLRSRTCACVLALLLVLSCISPATLAFALESNASHSDKDASSSATRTVNAGFFSYPGYHEIIDADSPTPKGKGYGSDFLQLLRRYTNLNFNYVGYDKTWPEMLEMLRSGEIDMVSLAKKTEETMEEFAFSEPIGRSYTEITVRSDDTRYHSGEYEHFDGMVIGMLKDSASKNKLATFAKENNFTYRAKYFSSEARLTDALNNHDIDAIAATSMRKRLGERRVARLAPEDYFVIVRKSDAELLSEINYGIAQMDTNEGDWRNELYYRNYVDDSTAAQDLVFTQRELDYIAAVQAGEKTITACAQPDRDPYSYVENGKLVGIIPEYFDFLMNMAGLPYTSVYAKDRQQHQEWTVNNTVDVYMDARLYEPVLAENYGVETAPYMQLTMSRVYRWDNDGPVRTVAVTDSQGLQSIEDGIYSDAQTLVCESREAAMEAVRDGKADACFVYTYMAERFINSNPDSGLAYHILNSPHYEMCMYISPNTDHELVSILNKCIRADDSRTLDAFVDKYTQQKQGTVSVTQFAAQNPWLVVAILVFFVSAVVIVALVMRNNRIVHKMADERLVYAADLQSKNAQLEELVEKEQKSNAASREFLCNMSHDIRTPMNAIMGFTNIALNQHPDEKINDCLEKIEESSEHLLTLINDVLDISRIESGKTKCVAEPVDICEVGESVLAIAEGFLLNRNLEFEVHQEKPSHPYVLADQVRIREVLVNILSNAIKFTEDGGRVSFSAEFFDLPVNEMAAETDKTEDASEWMTVRYTVADTGIGMSSEFLDKIFDEFTQEDSGARTQYKGTGLGMTITKRYVDLMHGAISVESEKGVGSTFVVELPLQLTSKESVHEQTEKTADVDLTGVKVLMAEDNDLNAEIATIQLEDCGMQITRVKDGKEAVDSFASNPAGTFDLVLMDIMMPEMNGIDAARAIRALESKGRNDARTIPIIAMTANAFAEDVQASLDAGMNAHIAKPLEMEKVKKVIARNLRLNLPGV